MGIFKDDTLLYPNFMHPELALADQIIIILIQLGYVLWKYLQSTWATCSHLKVSNTAGGSIEIRTRDFRVSASLILAAELVALFNRTRKYA